MRGQGELSARTIGHAHRVLSKALKEAAKNELVLKNVLAAKSAPKVASGDEMAIVRDVPAFVEKIRGHRLFTLGMVGLFTGMRLGEVLALRWGRVDVDRGTIQVREALEQTKKYGIRFKAPKSKAGRRDLTLPDLFWSTHCGSSAKSKWNCGSSSAPASCKTMAYCSPGMTVRRARRRRFLGHGATLRASAITISATPMLRSFIDGDVDIVTISKRLGHANSGNYSCGLRPHV